MLRICPKCGDFYTDALLAFCLKDGTPLVPVSPQSESWSDGRRVIEKKEEVLRQQKRKLKRRRIWLRAMTMLIVTMVMCVVAVNSFIYLQPNPEKEPTPATTSSEPIIPKPIEPVDHETAIPSPPPDTKSPVTTTSTSPTRPPTSSSSLPPPSKCSVADNGSEWQAISSQYRAQWRQNIFRERSNIIPRYMLDRANTNLLGGVPKLLENLGTIEPKLGEIHYESSFPKACTAFITASYVWEIIRNLNGRTNTVTIEKVKRFACVKTGETWRCK